MTAKKDPDAKRINHAKQAIGLHRGKLGIMIQDLRDRAKIIEAQGLADAETCSLIRCATGDLLGAIRFLDDAIQKIGV